MKGKQIRIGALISGGGSNLQALIDSCEKGVLNGRVVFAGSDNPDAGGLARAKSKDIPVFCVNYREIIAGIKNGSKSVPHDFCLDDSLSKQSLFGHGESPEKIKLFLESRAACEHELIRKISEYEFDVLALAGFMRTLSPYFIDRINTDPQLPKIINIHPALLPAFPGIDGYGDTFRYGCKVAGCTVHFIDYGEDSGPIIGQKSFPIMPEDTLETVKQKGLQLEWQLYPECIQLMAEDRIMVVKESYEAKGGKTLERKIVRIS